MRSRRTTLVALALIATSAFTASSAAGTPGSVGHGRIHQGPGKVASYVAMGDSYSATGIPPLDPGPGGSECGRSDATYSHLIAGHLDPKSFRDVACGGADTSNYFHPQYADMPAQLKALRPSTQLVTMTIGGNDGNLFSGAITACAFASVAEYRNTGSYDGAPCKTQYRRSFRKKVEQEIYPNLLKALGAVRTRAPRATVAILGYPTILPPVGDPGCYSRVPISMGDIPYLDRLQRTLNRIIERSARRTGVRFVDLTKVFQGHDACQPSGTRWIEPLYGNQSAAAHPNALGHQAMAAKTLRHLRL
jgi:lysophospholipase L1-like esterase